MNPGEHCRIKAPGFFLLFLISGILFFWPHLPTAQGTETLSSIEKQLKSSLPSSVKALAGIDFGESGFGSGVIVSKEGLIFTAAHVSGGVNRPCTIILSDGRRVRGVTLGLNAATDAGAVQITTPGSYEPVPLAKDLPQKGEWVYALGHSGGYNSERGYVTRLGKVIHALDDNIRTDCKLIGGDSGGPLFNMEGQLIGIHSRVGLVLEDNIHVPVPEFEKDREGLLNGEWVKPGPFAEKKPGKLNVLVTETPEGLRLSDLEPYEKDLRENDLLIKWNEKILKTKSDLEKLLADSYTGQKVTLTIKRQDVETAIPFILKALPQKNELLPKIRIPDFFSLPNEQEPRQKGDDE